MSGGGGVHKFSKLKKNFLRGKCICNVWRHFYWHYKQHRYQRHNFTTINGILICRPLLFNLSLGRRFLFNFWKIFFVQRFFRKYSIQKIGTIQELNLHGKLSILRKYLSTQSLKICNAKTKYYCNFDMFQNNHRIHEHAKCLSFPTVLTNNYGYSPFRGNIRVKH